MRVGLPSGPFTAGVLRGERARFQLFGDTVNTAARMESTGIQTKIQISQETAEPYSSWNRKRGWKWRIRQTSLFFTAVLSSISCSTDFCYPDSLPNNDLLGARGCGLVECYVIAFIWLRLWPHSCRRRHSIQPFRSTISLNHFISFHSTPPLDNCCTVYIRGINRPGRPRV
jgi:hypothetical protein